MAAYVPRKGHFVAVTFDRQSGHEQRGRRPALVVSNDLFNKHTGLCIACPITNRRRDYPFHVALPDPVFRAAEQLARRAHKSRSQLYADALTEYLTRHAPDEVTEAMNQVV